MQRGWALLLLIFGFFGKDPTTLFKDWIKRDALGIGNEPGQVPVIVDKRQEILARPGAMIEFEIMYATSTRIIDVEGNRTDAFSCIGQIKLVAINQFGSSEKYFFVVRSTMPWFLSMLSSYSNFAFSLDVPMLKNVTYLNAGNFDFERKDVSSVTSITVQDPETYSILSKSRATYVNGWQLPGGYSYMLDLDESTNIFSLITPVMADSGKRIQATQALLDEHWQAVDIQQRIAVNISTTPGATRTVETTSIVNGYELASCSQVRLSNGFFVTVTKDVSSEHITIIFSQTRLTRLLKDSVKPYKTELTFGFMGSSGEKLNTMRFSSDRRNGGLLEIVDERDLVQKTLITIDSSGRPQIKVEGVDILPSFENNVNIVIQTWGDFYIHESQVGKNLKISFI